MFPVISDERSREFVNAAKVLTFRTLEHQVYCKRILVGLFNMNKREIKTRIVTTVDAREDVDSVGAQGDLFSCYSCRIHNDFADMLLTQPTRYPCKKERNAGVQTKRACSRTRRWNLP